MVAGVVVVVAVVAKEPGVKASCNVLSSNQL